jgi:hypothetical protein
MKGLDIKAFFEIGLYLLGCFVALSISIMIILIAYHFVVIKIFPSLAICTAH